MLTIAKQDRYDMVNNPGDNKPSYTIWFSGCTMNCDGCYNTLLQDKNHGIKYKPDIVLFTICRECEKQEIDTIVLLGGEPMEQDHDDMVWLLDKLKSYGYKVWLYTGLEFEDISDDIKQYLYTIKCGKYDESQHVDGFPSSSNQRIFRCSNNQWTQIKLMEDQI